MRFYFNGQLTVANANADVLRKFLSSVTGGWIIDCGTSDNEISFYNYQCNDTEIIETLVSMLSDAGFTANGEISWYGDSEGRCVVCDNQCEWLDVSECYLRDADTHALINELIRRGYKRIVVTK